MTSISNIKIGKKIGARVGRNRSSAGGLVGAVAVGYQHQRRSSKMASRDAHQGAAGGSRSLGDERRRSRMSTRRHGYRGKAAEKLWSRIAASRKSTALRPGEFKAMADTRRA